MGRAVSSPAGSGGAPAEIEFGAFKMTSGVNNFNDFPEKSIDQIYSRIQSNEEIKIDAYC